MRLRLYKKFFFTTSAVLLVTLTLVYVLFAFAMNSYILRSKYALLDSSCLAVASNIESAENSASLDKIVNTAYLINRVNESDVFVANEQGVIISCGCENYLNEGSCTHSSAIIHESFLNSIDKEKNYSLGTLEGVYSEPHLISVLKTVAPSSDQKLYIIAVSNTLSIKELTKFMFGTYAIAAIIPLAFMFFAEYGLVYKLTKPLKYMSVAAKSIANGDFSKRVPVMSDDEIGELSVLFNKMTDSLAETEMTSRNFIANVSHELKTPMTVISGFIDGIIDKTIKGEERSHYLKIISDEIKRLSRLVQSMLSISKFESKEMTISPSGFDIGDMILNIVFSMEKNITYKNITIEGLDTLSHTEINADRDLIYQLLYNLTDNAVKYVDDFGRIAFSLYRIDKTVVFKVINTGKGILASDLKHIFEKFYKTDKSRSTNKDSLGLGLYICKTILDIHNGEITVNSEPDQFTEFTVTLPINYTAKE